MLFYFDLTAFGKQSENFVDIGIFQLEEERFFRALRFNHGFPANAGNRNAFGIFQFNPAASKCISNGAHLVERPVQFIVRISQFRSDLEISGRNRKTFPKRNFKSPADGSLFQQKKHSILLQDPDAPRPLEGNSGILCRGIRTDGKFNRQIAGFADILKFIGKQERTSGGGGGILVFSIPAVGPGFFQLLTVTPAITAGNIPKQNFPIRQTLQNKIINKLLLQREVFKFSPSFLEI